MNEPLRFSYSREEFVGFAHLWLRKQYKDKVTPEKFHEMLGLLVDYSTAICDSDIFDRIKKP